MDNKVTIYGKSGGELLKIDVDDNSYRYRAIMSTHTVTLYYSLAEHVEIPVGSYIIYQAERYTLWAPENFKKNSTRNFEYTVEFGDNTELLKLYKYKDLSEIPYRVKFPLTAKPKTFLKLLVDNMNLRDSGWSVGTCIDTVEKALSFNHEYCYDVLSRFASEWGTEWEVDGKTISLCKVEKFKSSPLPLSYGKGKGIVPGTGRGNQGDKKPVSLLYVQGGERNIDYSKYKSKSLLLPKSQELEYEGRHYVTDAHGMYITRVGSMPDIIREDSYDASDIYPKRVGTVTTVEVVDEKKNFYDIVDSSIPDELNFNDNLIAGETMTVIFQSGMLAGSDKEFEVKYFHDPILDEEGKVKKRGRRFEIVPQEIDGMIMPNAVYCPKANDTYAVFNVSLPDAYICNDSDKTGASWDMFRDAARYLYEHEEVEFTFSGTLDGIWSKKKWLEIGGRILPGAYIRFSDIQFQPDGIDIRITGVKDYINKPYSPEIELSNTPVAGYVSSDLGKIDANEVINEGNHKGALQFTKRRFRDAMETMSMLEDALLNFSGAINPIAIQTMQLLVGDESLQFRFVTSKTNPVVISYNITYDIKKKVFKAPAAILQHMTMGIDTITASHKAGDYKFWDMAEYNSPPLVDAAKKYYMYAKVSKDNSTGTFLLSETAIKIEDVAGYYHLLVGILNSEYEGERSFVELYGFTEILPGRITTDRIVSTDGKTYFDLVRSEIGGKIKFAYGSSGLENLEEWAEVRQDIDAATQAAKDANDAVGGLHDYIDGAFADGIITEAEAKAIEKYINSVNNAKASVEATYNKLYMNAYLTGAAKTGLLNAKVTLMGTIENLIKSINTAIADGKTTVAEKNDVDAKYAAFNTAYADFTTAVEVANKAIQDELKKYSDEALKEAKKAKEAADAAAKSASDANNAVSELDQYVDGAFADGIISEAEAKAIEKYINSVNNAKASVEATYNKLYMNAYLTGAAKTGLLNAKVTLMGTIENLIKSINTAIADGKTTVAEKNDVDAKYAAFNTAYADFTTAVEVANKAIQDELKKYSDEALKEAKKAKEAADAAAKSASDANNAVSELDQYVDGAFADGIISEAEAKAIEKYINSVNNAKASVEATYNKLYMNAYLTGAAKTGLLNAKVTLMGTIENLIKSINTAIADGKTTVAEKNDVDAKFALFNSAYADLMTAIETAYKAIQDKLKEYSDDAKDYAGQITATAKDNMAQGLGYADYKALSDAAKGGNTIITGGKINTELIEATAIITSQILANIINANGLKIGGDKFVVSVDENKQVNVSIKGRVEAMEGVFYGSIAEPAQPIGANTLLSFNTGFNFSGYVSSGVKEIKLPSNAAYSGVSCSIINTKSTSGYFKITCNDGNNFMYTCNNGSMYDVSSIYLYGIGELRLKAVLDSSNTVRWFVENDMNFSYKWADKAFTNGLPSPFMRIIDLFELNGNSLNLLFCADGNTPKISWYDKRGQWWGIQFAKSRSSHKKKYHVIAISKVSIFSYWVKDISDAGFTVGFANNGFITLSDDGVATVYVIEYN